MKEMWVLCPDCGRMNRARKSMVGAKIICTDCEEVVGQMKSMHIWDCPECGRTICEPEDKAGMGGCPCGYRPAVEEPEPEPQAEEVREETPAPAPVPEEKPDPVLNLKCPKCQAKIKNDNGAYRCRNPKCRMVFSEDDIEGMLYFKEAEAEQEAITIAWDTAGEMGHLLYVHSHSGTIPAGSVLIVADNQKALYQAAGKYYLLEPNAYSLFWDKRSEEERRASLQFGAQNRDLPIQLNTKVIFFDTTIADKAYIAPEPLALHGTEYNFRPIVNYQLVVTDPLELMTKKFTYATYEQEQNVEIEVMKWVEQAILAVLRDKIDYTFTGEFTSGLVDMETALRQQLDKLFDRHNQYDALTAEINERMGQLGRGIEIVAIASIDTAKGLEEQDIGVVGMDLSYRAPRAIDIQGAGYQFRPQVKYRVGITDEKAVRQNLGLKKLDDVNAMRSSFEIWTQELIFSVMSNWINSAFAAGFVPGTGNIRAELQRELAGLFDEQNNYRRLVDEINIRLNNLKRGIRIEAFISVDTQNALEASIPASEAVECPKCHVRLRKQMRVHMKCKTPGCNTIMWICQSCGALNVNTGASRVCSCGAANYFDD